MKVRYTARALANLDSIFSWIDAENPAAAARVKHRIQLLAEGLSDFPFSGRATGLRDLRVLSAGRLPYLIYYRVSRQEIQIVHIRDARRRPLKI